MHLTQISWPKMVLAAAALALVAGCGGGDDAPTPVPNPNPNDALGSQQIETAQATVEPAATPVDASATVLTAVQIDTQQRTAVDRSAVGDTATIDEKQAGLDGGEDLVPAF